MISLMLKKFARDRRGATAVLIALMTVPLIICCGAAVDFSRVASARAQLQAATDAAALAGVGAYQTNADGTAAYNVANTAFMAASNSLTSYASITSSSVGTACAGNGVQCGTTSANSATPSNCPGAYDYCVQVIASVKLQNSLIAHWIPSDVLSASSTATSNFPYQNTVNQGNFTHTSVGRGSDLSGIYAYVVPEDSAGNPEYGNVPPPNSNCNSAAYGPVYLEPNKSTAGNGVTTCNYLLIGESTGGSGTGSLTFAENDPIAFTFVNFTGGTITGTADLDDITTNSTTLASTVNANNAATHYANELYVNGAYYPNGVSVCSNAPASCSNPNVPLYATCPAHTLYGSITAYPNVDNNIVPLQDSINTYSSAYEYLGYPPTHGVNHALLPFLGPVSQFTQKGASTSNTPYYKVQAVCPQWPTAGTNISATATLNPGSLNTAYSTYPTETVVAYATYFPDETYSDGTSNVYPPAINGCTPIISATAALPNASTTHPWWGWSPSNGADYDPAETGVHNCSFNKVSVAGTISTINEPSHMQATPFTTRYNNCTFLAQPLGTNISNLPDYYTYTANPSATAGTLGNAANITSLTPVYDNGAFPAGFSNSGTLGISISSIVNGLFTVTEPPAGGDDNAPPEDTSHQCYDPRYNGIDGNTLPASDQPNNDPSPALPVDAVERPDLGVVFCNQNPPDSYGLYWNDMGAWAEPSLYNDDIGYWNAITEFTCPTPAINKSGGGGPASLSG